MRRALLALVLLGSALLAGCTGSGDGDGLGTDVEANGWVVRVTYPNKTVTEYHVTSDSTQGDTDGDGLNDFRELQQSSDPRNIDTDRDRLLDGPKLCPEAGTAIAERILERDILPHPTEQGCYVGELPWEYDGMSINTKITDAHSDNSLRIGDNLTDSREIVGWNVTLDGRTYHTFSNPSTQTPDTDNDGLHDGLELKHRLDPRKPDTDGDGVNDMNDAAPLGNLKIPAELVKINLKENPKVTGGADLLMEVRIGALAQTAGPESIPQGTSRPKMPLTFDVDDQASNFEGRAGAGNWEADVIFGFYHDSNGNGEVDDSDETIRVTSSGSQQHYLNLRYRAFDDSWTGDARGGTSSGPDADVTIDLNTLVK